MTKKSPNEERTGRTRKETRQSYPIYRKSNQAIRDLFFADFDSFLNLLPDGTNPTLTSDLFNQIFDNRYLKTTKDGRLSWEV